MTMPGDSSSVQRIRAVISGRVQGVFFRASTMREALALGLVGSATNLADGRVQVIAQGPGDDVQVLVDWLHRGPPLARVESVSCEQIEPDPDADRSFAKF